MKPLWSASYEGKVEVVEVLINQGAEVNLPTEVSVRCVNNCFEVQRKCCDNTIEGRYYNSSHTHALF